MYEESSLCDIRGLTDFHTCIITSHQHSTRARHTKTRSKKNIAKNKTESIASKNKGGDENDETNLDLRGEDKG
jgi:hypothetical protein